MIDPIRKSEVETLARISLPAVSRCTVFLAGLFLIPVLAFCQAITATVAGTVTDPSGAVVPGAVISVRNQQTNQSRQATADALGNYEFLFLPAGTYTLAGEAAGFQRVEVSPFTLSIDQVARVDIKMALGQSSDAVQVTASAIGLQTENATVGTVVDGRQVVELPLNGRSFVQLALLTPGVNPGTPGAITVRRLRGSLGQAAGMSANGARDVQNRFYYDGVEAMDLDSYSFSFSPSIDAIQEFKVQSSTYSAEMGGAPGGHVNLTTRSGSNTFHGTVWEFNRNDALTALNGFQPRVPGAKPPRLNRNQFGANLGGPALLPLYSGRNRTFFFFNWEAGRQVAGSFGSQAMVPPVPLRAGDFSGVTARVFDPQTRQPFPGNMIPANRVASYARKYLDQFVPLPNANEPGINYRGPRASAPITQDQYTTRIDHSISARDTLSASYIFNTQADDTVPTFVFDTRGNVARAQNLSLTEVHVFSPSLVNEARAGWHRFFEHEYFGSTDRAEYDVANLIGIPGVSKDPRNYGAPVFTAGYSLPSVRTNGPRDRMNQVWSFADNISMRRGRHSIKAGALVTRRNLTFDQSANPRGTFGFNGTVTAGGVSPTRDHQFAQFLLGLATDAQVSTSVRATRLNAIWQAYYFQNDWRLSPSLTLNFGMRYEYLQPPIQRGKESSFELNGFIPVRQILSGFPDIPDTPGYPHALVFGDRTNFGPRFGFAWSVPRFRDLVVRGGYGVYYTQEIANAWSSMANNPPITERFSFSGTATNPIQVETAFLAQGRPDVISNGAVVDPNLRNGYTQQWNFTIQKKLPKQVYVDLAYVGSKGTRLGMTYDGNRPIEIIPAGKPVTPIAQRRPYRGWDNINVTKSIASSIYHAMQLKVERRVGDLSILGAYTWSKSLANADSSGGVGSGSYSGGAQDYMDSRGSRSTSLFDVPHRMSAAAIYNVPLFRSSPSAAARALLGGWQLGTIITEQTGFSAAVAGGVDTTGTGVASRLNAVYGQKPMLPRDQRTRERWFNTAAFAPPVTGSWGTIARQPLHLPGVNQVDFSATKAFRIRERHQFQLRGEFFNFFNHVNLGAPGLNIRDPVNFGRVTSTSQGGDGMPGDARIVQFALKYVF